MRLIRVANVENAILENVAINPGTSTRGLALHYNVSKTTVWRILKEQQLHPYHVQKNHCLQPQDYQRRQKFLQLVRRKNKAKP